LTKSTPLEQHLADFILKHCRGDHLLDYRRRNFELWEKVYGVELAERVRNLVKKGWKK
jgi:hypothetical protein